MGDTDEVALDILHGLKARYCVRSAYQDQHTVIDPSYAGTRGFRLLTRYPDMSEDADREEGVDFTDFNPVLEDISFPITKAELVDEHGEHTIERTNADPITIRELFEGMGEQTFESREEVRQSVLNLMPRESVGRAGYSDRGGSTPEEGQPDEQSNETM